MTFEFHPEALDEYRESALWYGDRKLGLDEEFMAAVERAIEQIFRDPTRFQPIEGEIRIFRMKRFPFAIYYEVDRARDHLKVFAVAHTRRRPNYWQHRHD